MFLRDLVWTSTGKKYVMALTGLLMIGFVSVHLAGNILFIIGPEPFNSYAHFLINHPLIYVAEAILITIFAVHIGMGLTLAFQNLRARPKKYHINKTTGRGSTFFSSTMPYTGLLILIALVMHIMHFKFGTHFQTMHGTVQMRDFHKLLVVSYSNPIFIILYLAFVTILGFHVGHGVQSAFQSFGINHPRYTPGIKIIGLSFALLVALGFSIVPFAAYYLVGV